AEPDVPVGGAMLDWTLEPNFGDVELETGFIPDPYEVTDILSGGELYAGDSVEGCSGYVTAQPDLNFYWTGEGFLRVFFVPDDGTSDATLIINDAYAEWHCNDDAYGWNPAIDFDDAPSGWYAIWIGSWSADEFIAGTLYFTEMDITPDDISN
nr:hypothetical protein [Anaerolineae bacterium]